MTQQDKEVLMRKYNEAFALFDKDKDGLITFDELRDVLNALDQNPTNAELDYFLHDVDLDKDDCLNFDEFVKLINRIMAADPTESKEHFEEAFKVFDRDGDGYIDVDELRFVMTTLGEKLTDAEVNEMMKEADTNGDGKIDYQEFVSMMMSMK